MIVFKRDAWHAAGGRGAILAGRAMTSVVVHHTGDSRLPLGCTLAHEKAIVKNIETFHVVDRGWLGIGYNWLITQHGHVYEGRGWSHAGAHAPGRNNTSVGVAFTIDGEADELSRAAVEAFRELVKEGVELGHIAADFELVGHRDVRATTCPGAKIYDRLAELA